MTTATLLKSRRLVDNERVREIRDGIYVVAGDHGSYLVTIADPGEVEFARLWLEAPPVLPVACSCRYVGVCSHIGAATLHRERAMS